METELLTSSRLNVARRLSPDDIEVGIYVAVLRETCEYVRGCCSDMPRASPLFTERIDTMPDEDDVGPLKVVGACLPYVLAQKPDGTCRTLDVRRFALACLAPEYGKAAFRRLKPKAEKTTDESGNRKKKRKSKRTKKR